MSAAKIKRGRVGVEVYEQKPRKGAADQTNTWRYRLRNANGQVVSGPQEAFTSKSNAKRAARAFMLSVYRTVVDEIVANPPQLDASSAEPGA